MKPNEKFIQSKVQEFIKQLMKPVNENLFGHTVCVMAKITQVLEDAYKQGWQDARQEINKLIEQN